MGELTRCAITLTHGIRIGQCLARHERAERAEWRRRELNPRPKITLIAASTCVVGLLISIQPAGIDTLRRNPDVCFSSLHQRPNEATSPLFRLARRGRPRYAEVT
jgi:hypothetical protein